MKNFNAFTQSENFWILIGFITLMIIIFSFTRILLLFRNFLKTKIANVSNKFIKLEDINKEIQVLYDDIKNKMQCIESEMRKIELENQAKQEKIIQGKKIELKLLIQKEKNKLKTDILKIEKKEIVDTINTIAKDASILSENELKKEEKISDDEFDDFLSKVSTSLDEFLGIEKNIKYN